jgi:hypothetical protein
MAYDPEARQTGNMAMVIGIIVLILIVGGAIVYMTSRPSSVVTTPSAIIHDQAPAPQAVPVPVPSSPAPNVTINPPAPSSSSSTTTTTTDKGTSSGISTSSGSE